LVKITAVRGPFGGDRISAELAAGGSIADLMRALGIEPEVAARALAGVRSGQILDPPRHRRIDALRLPPRQRGRIAESEAGAGRAINRANRKD
jgi:hypothetical protein